MQNVKGFIDWLKKHGCTILKPTNKYEVARWRGKELGIVYTTGKTNKFYAKEALYKFENGKVWHGGIHYMTETAGNKDIDINLKFKTLEIENTLIISSELKAEGFTANTLNKPELVEYLRTQGYINKKITAWKCADLDLYQWKCDLILLTNQQ
jgi:hypothetical protein